MKKHLTREEQETLIIYSNLEKTCDIDTADPVVIRKLNSLCAKYPEDYQKIKETKYEDGSVCSVQYKTKKRDIIFRKPRIYTEEQIKELKERGKRLAEISRKKREEKSKAGH